MATTPEGKVKQKVKEVLKRYRGIYFDMPVPGGFGKPTLDFVGCYNSFYFAIETKAAGKEPTIRQRQTIKEMREAGGAVFVITGEVDEAGFLSLIGWLEEHKVPTDHDHTHLASA